MDTYIAALPEERGIICSMIRDLLLDCVPGIDERLSFGLPFYHYFGMLLYYKNSEEGIQLCFCRGKDLVLTFPQLAQKGRAIVASISIRIPGDIKALEVREIICAAADWNKEARLMNLPMVKQAKRKKTG